MTSTQQSRLVQHLQLLSQDISSLLPSPTRTQQNLGTVLHWHMQWAGSEVQRSSVLSILASVFYMQGQ